MYTEYHITMDSFGQDCPTNWEEIAEYLNDKIDALEDITDDTGALTPEGRDLVDAIWEDYCNACSSGSIPAGAPVPFFE